jgi:hypothetical protein
MAWVLSQYVATDRQIAEQVEKFRNHHQGKGSLMADWTAAWRTWWGYGYHKHPRRGAGAWPAGKDCQLSVRPAADPLVEIS